MNEILLNLHPAIAAVFGVLWISLVAAIVWAVIISNGSVSSGYNEQERESNWGKP